MAPWQFGIIDGKRAAQNVILKNGFFWFHLGASPHMGDSPWTPSGNCFKGGVGDNEKAITIVCDWRIDLWFRAAWDSGKWYIPHTPDFCYSKGPRNLQGGWKRLSWPLFDPRLPISDWYGWASSHLSRFIDQYHVLGEKGFGNRHLAPKNRATLGEAGGGELGSSIWGNFYLPRFW